MEVYGFAMTVITSQRTRVIVMSMLKPSILFMVDTLVKFVERLWKQAIPTGAIKLNPILINNKNKFALLWGEAQLCLPYDCCQAISWV